MAEDYKTGISPNPYLFREVGPVAPYPRINPHQPKREEYPRQQSGHKQGQDRSRRRFGSMRELVERLKESFQISRIDYNTAEIEMHNQGLAVAEELIISQLLQLKIPLNSIEGMFQQIRQQRSTVTLIPGRKLNGNSYLLFPEEVDGLLEYCLVFSNLQLHTDRQESRIIEGIDSQERFISEAAQLRLTFRRSLPTADTQQNSDLLQLDIQILVGAIEIDDAGRRAILYRRSEGSFGLYSDKQINLSI